jgi:hypothetical protein
MLGHLRAGLGYVAQCIFYGAKVAKTAKTANLAIFDQIFDFSIFVVFFAHIPTVF